MKDPITVIKNIVDIYEDAETVIDQFNVMMEVALGSCEADSWSGLERANFFFLHCTLTSLITAVFLITEKGNISMN